MEVLGEQYVSLDLDIKKLPSINDGYYEVVGNRLICQYSDKIFLELAIKVTKEYFVIDVLTDYYIEQRSKTRFCDLLLNEIINQIPVPLLVNTYYVPRPELPEKLKTAFDILFEEIDPDTTQMQWIIHMILKEYPSIKSDIKWQEHFSCSKFNSDDWLTRRIVADDPYNVLDVRLTDRNGKTITYEETQDLKEGFLIYSKKKRY